MEKIRIGDIKVHSIMLLYPDLELSYDSESETSLNGVIENLKYNPNVRDVLHSSIPAINRAFTIIEKRGGTKTKSFGAFVSKRMLGKLWVKLSEIANDVYRIVRVYSQDGKTVPFECISDDDICLDTNETGEYIFIYKSKLRRISEFTDDFMELDLSEGVAEIIPYFVKSEILLTEDRGASDAARILFDGILNELSYLPGASLPEVTSVYYME